MSQPIRAFITVDDRPWFRVPTTIGLNYRNLARDEPHEMEGMRVLVVYDGEIPDRKASTRIAGGSA